ncbi:ATP-binding protein [Sphingobacterium oryzagri]|uniref:ATP-binding protein n=1 Tax=Sphingobacterium oryzagri TaxID=3025669 RepID=A0ABY7WJC7_9SPHI|nr:ATP-binding protein [Sphingobacterium sp. KACC 22765]WDF68682.1 ATP-binding protein [Sphingobacterium sp. KACC 22765]
MSALDSILKIGSVVSVLGRSVEIKVDTAKNASHLLYKGELLKNVSVGSYIKIAKGFTHLVGKIEGEFITEDKSRDFHSYTSEQEKIRRLLQISLIGFLEGNVFKQGVKELPLVDNEAYLLTQDEFNYVHKFVKDDEETFVFGSLAQEKGKAIEVSIDRLLASHIGIFGNTGSGKSYTLAKLYHEILSKYKDEPAFQKNARFILIDFNGEYMSPEEGLSDDVIISSRYKQVFRLSTGTNGSKKKYRLPNKIINDEQFWSLILHCTEKTQSPFISRTLKSEFLEDNIHTDEGFKKLITVTLEHITTKVSQNQEKNLVLTFLEELAKFGIADKIDNYKAVYRDLRANLQFHSKDKYFYYNNVISTTAEFLPLLREKLNVLEPHISEVSIIQKIRLKIIFNFYYEIQNGFANKEHIGPVMGRLDDRINDLEKVIEITQEKNEPCVLSVISLKDVNIQMRKILPMIICKHLYEEKKGKIERDKFLNIIIDEAHNILSFNSDRESETWKDYRLEAFEEIIKEGRKFGVFLTIASQRPSDISSTIISQLHNYFLHRLINNKDIEAVEKTISYLDKVSFDSLPILPQGSCILAGISAQLPVIIEVGFIPDKNKPYNETMVLTKHWRDEIRTEDNQIKRIK